MILLKTKKRLPGNIVLNYYSEILQNRENSRPLKKYVNQTFCLFLNSYLKYTHIISQCSYTTVDEAYYDLRTFFRYLVLVNNKVIDKDFSIESFKSISIKDVSIDDMKEIKTQNITKFVQFCRNVLGNSSKTTNRKLASVN